MATPEQGNPKKVVGISEEYMGPGLSVIFLPYSWGSQSIPHNIEAFDNCSLPFVRLLLGCNCGPDTRRQDSS